MLRRAEIKQSRLLLVVLLCSALFVTLVGALLGQLKNVQAQDDNSDIRSLLEQLNSEFIIQNQGEINIRFVSPVGDQLDQVRIPNGNDNGELRFSLKEIGDDYFCISQNQGGVYFVNCIPYTNIASITYTE